MAKKTKITLPCGYVHTDVNGEKKVHTDCEIVEFDHSVDKDLANRDLTTLDLVSRHVLRIGPFMDRRELDLNIVPELEKGDLDWITIQLRVLALGPIYRYQILCPKPACIVSRQVLDLDKIECFDMPDPLVRGIEYKSDSGHILVFRNVQAKDSQAIADIHKSRSDELNKLLALRLVSVDEKTVAQHADSRNRKCVNPDQHVTEGLYMLAQCQLALREREDIRTKLKNLMGRPNLRVQSKCTECKTSWESSLIIDANFMMPSQEE